jgi:hypothetical protein
MGKRLENQIYGVDEITSLLDILRRYPIKNILEIGVGSGSRLAKWVEMFEPELVVGLDGDCSKLDVNLITRLSNTVVIPFEPTSMEGFSGARRFLSEVGIDLLYIDGERTYEELDGLFRIYEPMVNNGGIIVFDNDLNLNGDSSNFWYDIPQSNHYRSISYNHGDGTGVFIK